MVPAVRASIDASAAIRPGGAVETDRLPSDVRDRTIRAVDSLGGRVTVGDVAAQAGLKLDEAERALQALAADTDGFLEVMLIKFYQNQCAQLVVCVQRKLGIV